MNTKRCSKCGDNMLHAYSAHFESQVRFRDKDGNMHAPMVRQQKSLRKPICEMCYARSLRESVQEVLFWEDRPELCVIWSYDWVLTGYRFGAIDSEELTE